MKLSQLRPLFVAPFVLAGLHCTVEPESDRAEANRPKLSTPTEHRSEALTCPARLYAEDAAPRPAAARGPGASTTPQAIVAGPSIAIPCTRQADCDQASPESRCISNDGGKNFFCILDSCFADGDCQSNEVCNCDAARGDVGGYHCVSSNCRVDADCGPDGYCSPSYDSGCGRFGGYNGYYCHTPDDECASDADCDNAYGSPCVFAPAAGRWVCFQGEGCVG